jgi:hypothetical protein
MGDKRERMTDDLDQIVSTDHGFSKEDILNQPLWMRLALVVMLLVMVITVVFLVSKAIPWEPFQIHSQYLHPIEVCPLERVETIQDVELQGGWFTFSGLRGETYWLDKDGRHQGGTYTEIDRELLIPVPRQSIPSSSVRYAPPEAGEWSTGARAILTGHRLGFISVEQEIEIESTNSVTVKEWNDPSCAERFNPDG